MTYFDPNPPRTVGEKYARATITSDLTVSVDDQTDADKLLAAGFAAAGNTWGQMALALWRLDMNHVCTRHELAALHDFSASKVFDWSRSGGRWRLGPGSCAEVAQAVVRWWVDSVCPACEGRKVDLIPGTRKTGANLCSVCRGHGKADVTTRVSLKRQPAAEMLADEYRAMLAFIFGQMSTRLSGFFDVDGPPIPVASPPELLALLADLRSDAAAKD